MTELHRSNNLKNIEEMIQEEETITKYKKLRPYISRLFTHVLLLIIAIQAYLNYLDSTVTYLEFIEDLGEKVIVDIRKIDSSQTCSSIGYEEITKSKFPKIMKGCRCDNKLLTGDICKNLTKSSNTENTTNCVFQDAIISKSLTSSIVIPSQYSSDEVEKIKKLIVPYNNKRYLADKVENGKFKQELPNKCRCYQDIEESESQDIELFFKKKRICVLKDDSLTTIKYMISVTSNCTDDMVCQKFFCKQNKNDTCPLVDAWFDNQNRTIFPGNQELFIYNDVSYIIFLLLSLFTT